MRIIERYIGITMLTHVAMVLLVLLALYFFSTLMAEMENVGKGQYNVVEAVRYSLMLLPRQSYELFPLVALVGTILGIGSLANSNELTVLRAAGTSVRQIAWMIMKFGFKLILLVVVLGESLAPYMEKQAHIERLEALSQSVSFHSSDGLWARDGDYFLNIGRLFPGGQAGRIQRYRFEGLNLVSIDYSPRGQHEENGWRVTKVTTIHFDEQGAASEQKGEEFWPSTLTPEVINVATLPAENLALWELFEFIDYLHENGLAAQRYETAVWVRIFTPLATAAMILLALPFVFGSLRAVTIGQRVMIGSLIGIIFYLVNGMFSRLGLIFDMTPLVSAGTPTLIVLFSAIYMMRRIH